MKNLYEELLQICDKHYASPEMREELSEAVKRNFTELGVTRSITYDAARHMNSKEYGQYVQYELRRMGAMLGDELLKLSVPEKSNSRFEEIYTYRFWIYKEEK